MEGTRKCVGPDTDADESPGDTLLLEPEDIFGPQLLALTRGAIERISDNLNRNAPGIAGEITSWMACLSRTRNPEDYFREARAYILLVPWWAEKSIRGVPDFTFQSDLIYSTLNAYYFIRLIDDLMDGHPGTELRMLPVLGFFHSQFQAVHARYFPPGSPFWDFFHATWTAMAQAAMRDAGMAEISAVDFTHVATAKSAGVKIPIAAVLLQCGREDLLQPWCEFYDGLAAWNRMVDDVFDSLEDAHNGRVTYLLSEAKRRKRSKESVTAWLIREGFAWGCEQAESHSERLSRLAEALGSSDVRKYIEHRRNRIASRWEHMRPGLAELAQLAAVLEE
jgi:hypothetical protein